MRVPFCPRISLTASMSVMSLVDLPSISIIRSPARIPARNAGVSSIGLTTVGAPFFSESSMPKPAKLPFVAS